MSFSTIAEFYDRINGSAYGQYAEFVEKAFEQSEIPVREVLDLGCGTGGICAILADKGFDMVALDISPEMLMLAREKNFGKNTLILCQDMREFELYGTVQGAYSSFDCLNYITESKDLSKVFVLLRNYLEKGGIFVFDVNTAYRYENILDGRSYVYEIDGDMAIWRSAYDRESGICNFDIDLFSEDGKGNYRRSGETQIQKLHTRDDILSAAEGFELLEISGGKGFDGCAPEEKEYYIFKRI